MKGKILKGYLFAIVSAIIYGCMPLMAKHIYADGVNPMSLVFFRNVFSLVPLGLLAFAESKTLKVPIKQLPSICLMSLLGCCITPILLFTSYQFIESGTATVFHFVYPAIVVIFEIIFMKKKIQFGNLLSVILCVAGIFMFYSPGQTLNLTGSALALSSGLTFAFYVVLLSNFDNSRVSGFLFAFYNASVSTVASLVFCLAANSFTTPSTLSGWGLCVLFSMLITTGAVTLFQKSAFLIGSERTSILSTLEPITSVVVGIIIFHEPLGLRTAIGSVLVISASLLVAIIDMKNAKNTSNKKA